MTTEYRKKPVIIEAIQWTGKNHKEIIDWSGAETVKFVDRGNQLVVRTSEGEMRAPVGHWILRGVEGEFYPCSDSVFEKTYDKVAA